MAVPKRLVRTTGASPASWAGTRTSTRVGEAKVTVAGAPPTVTAGPGARSVPSRATTVSPSMDTLGGATAVIAGTGW